MNLLRHPWIFADVKERCMHCTRCGKSANAISYGDGTHIWSRLVLRFIQAHRDCDGAPKEVARGRKAA